MDPTTISSDPAGFVELLQFTQRLAQGAVQNGGFVSQRGDYGYHILFNESEMVCYFDGIRDRLTKGKAGSILMAALAAKQIRFDSSNEQIWERLVQSLEFSGIDFEHLYKILPSEEVPHERIWDYTFEENIVLGHSILVAPVMQHYGPLCPKLDLKGPTKKLKQAQPLLAVGMIGDCVKGTFFDEIKEMADKGDEVAISQRDTLLHPERLQQKMRGLTCALLRTCRQYGDCSLLMDAVLVGSGAFGGSARVLAQPFVDSLNGGDLPFDNFRDEVNFFMFPPPKPEELTLEPMKYKATLNPKQGLGATSETTSKSVRVVVAGFDPISIAPHGVLNRAFSAEGQLSHATDILERLTNERGQFVSVLVPTGSAWENAAAFFAKPQEPKYKEEPGYDTVRFVPNATLQAFGLEEGREVQLVAKERVPPRVWNGDAFDGWILTLEGKEGKTWQDILRPTAAPDKRKKTPKQLQSPKTARDSSWCLSDTLFEFACCRDVPTRS